MIKATRLTKQYGDFAAVNDLSFEVKPGIITGFLGPNGAGKTTSMRLILGLDKATAGEVSINGRAYRETPVPMQEIGALIDPSALNPGRSAYDHLLWQAQAGGLPRNRVDDVLEMVGLSDVAGKRAGEFSLGMKQRLGIASALLGDPPVLLFDEPVNGLDPEGIRWIRALMRRFAAENRTVFVSSHLMSEMEQTADHLLVIGKGKLIADLSLAEMTRQSSERRTIVRSRRAAELIPLIEARGGCVHLGAPNQLIVKDLDSAEVGALAFTAGIALDELSTQRPTLEAAFMEMTRESVEYRADVQPTVKTSSIRRSRRALAVEGNN